MTTIGDMIDKLTIANIRIWHLEDTKREHHDGTCILSERDISAVLAKISNTNRERNNLIDGINAGLQVLIDRAAGIDNSHLSIDADGLLGTGKNKFYKGEPI